MPCLLAEEEPEGSGREGGGGEGCGCTGGGVPGVTAMESEVKGGL